MERSRRTHLMHFNIAGFTYYDGPLAFEHLKNGVALQLQAEPANGKDQNAVAIYHDSHKLGYVPKSMNSFVAAILNAGHNIFDTRVVRVSPEASPEEQVMVTIHVMGADGGAVV